MCHGAVIVGGLSVRLQRPEVHLRGEVRHRGHPKAAEGQNQYNVSEDTDEDTDKDTDEVAIGDTVKFAIGVTVKFAIVSSVFVGLRTFSVSSICPSVVVGVSGQSAVIEHFEGHPKRPRVPWSPSEASSSLHISCI